MRDLQSCPPPVGAPHRRRFLLACTSVCLLLGADAPPDPARAPSADGRRSAAADAFNRIAQDYAEARWRARPSDATEAGVHKYDNELERLDPATVAARQRALQATLERMLWLDGSELPPALRIDARFLTARVHGELAALQEDRRYQRNPGLYVALAGASVNSLLKRSFAPLCQRLQAAAARAAQVPRLLAEARANLTHPPRLWTELALADSDGAVSFFTTVVPAAAAGCAEPRTRDALTAAAAQAAAALRGYQDFLRRELLPRSDGDYVLGAARFAAILHDEELIDEPLPALLQRGQAELLRLRAALDRVAHQIDARHSPAEVLAAVTRQHPRADQLLPETRAQVQEVRRFIIDHAVVPIPAGEDLRVEETPLFYRQTSFASMSSPGPFEERAREAFFYVTPVEPSWPPERQEEHLRAFDRFAQENTIIHEAYPGHYVQGLYAHQAPTLVRKLLSAGAYSEGWALYCERMLLDAGFDPDPRERLIMLQWALVRAARYVGTIELHGRGMPLNEVIRFIKEQALFDTANAEREAFRYTLDPMVLVYTYGDLAITALRAQYERQLGPRFRLGEFHARLLREGPLPVPLLTAALAQPAATLATHPASTDTAQRTAPAASTL